MTAAEFEPRLHDRFRLTADGTPPFDVELIDVSEGASPGTGRPQFSLVFRGGPTPPLPQRIYRIEHGEMGPLDLFLVPLGPDSKGQRYEAVFT